MAPKTIKETYKNLTEAIHRIGVSTTEAAEALGRARLLFNNMRLRDGVELSIYSESQENVDSIESESWEREELSRFVCSSTADPFYHNVESSYVVLGGDPVEAEKLGDISRAIGIGVRELLSLFTKVGNKCRVRRDLVEKHYLNTIEPYMINGVFDITNIRTPILMVNGKYEGFLPLDDSEVVSIIKVRVKVKSSTVPTLRVIRTQNDKPKELYAIFQWAFDVGVENCRLILPVFNTAEKVWLSKDGNYYKEV